MPFLKIWIHAVWAVKNREPLLKSKYIRYQAFQHIRQNAIDKKIHLDFVNGHVDHIHCLISLKQEQSIAKVLQLIKGESSHWINETHLCDSHFEWQDEYYAVSVSESIVDKVRDYIKNQEEHHKTKSFEQECEEFMIRYKFD